MQSRVQYSTVQYSTVIKAQRDCCRTSLLCNAVESNRIESNRSVQCSNTSIHMRTGKQTVTYLPPRPPPDMSGFFESIHISIHPSIHPSLGIIGHTDRIASHHIAMPLCFVFTISAYNLQIIGRRSKTQTQMQTTLF